MGRGMGHRHRRWGWCLVLGVGLACGGCRRLWPWTAEPSDAGNNGRPLESALQTGWTGSSSASAGARSTNDGPVFVGSRCVAEGNEISFPEGTVADGLVGEMVRWGQGAAIGVLRRTKTGPEGGILRWAAWDEAPTFVSLGLPLGDGPPPRPLPWGDGLGAAFYTGKGPEDAKVPGRAGRTLGFFALDGAASRWVGSVPQGADESLAFDVASSAGAMFVVWDDDREDASTGVIRGALLAKDGQLSAPWSLSPPGSDAEEPRVFPRPGGYWVLWLARSEEAQKPVMVDAYVPEGPAESRSYRWLEGVAVGENGQPVEGVRVLSSKTGRLSHFDGAGRGSSGEVFVVALDETEQRPGEGGHVMGGSLRSGETLKSLWVGRVGTGSLWVGPEQPWPAMAFSDSSDRVALLPVGGPAGQPVALPSLESRPDSLRVLGVWGPLASTPDRLPLLALRTGTTPTLQRLLCAR